MTLEEMLNKMPDEVQLEKDGDTWYLHLPVNIIYVQQDDEDLFDFVKRAYERSVKNG